VEESTKGIKVKCVYCSEVFVGGALRIRNHLAGDSKSADITKCSAVPDGVVNHFKRKNVENEIAATEQRKLHDLDLTTRSSITSTSLAGMAIITKYK
jgi:hypothetical protein